MPAAILPPDEDDRLAALRCYRILDTPDEGAFDDFVSIASFICDVPIALVSLIDTDRQWFKAKIGIEATETHRDLAFCAHSILDNHTLVVNDAEKDDRFSDNALVTGDPHIRFYAGVPLITPDGYALGTLCAIDQKPRELTREQLLALEAVARQVVVQLELRLATDELQREIRVSHEAHAALAESEDHLRRTNEELEQFAFVASHDLKEPLRMVVSYVQLLERRYAEKLDDEAREIIGFAADGAQRMRALIDDLLAFSRVGTRGTAFSRFKVCDAVDRALANLRVAIAESGALIECDELPEITGDPSQVTQLFQNLLANAIKFRGERSPVIRISAHEQQEESTVCRFFVEDNGIGIEPAHRDRIFLIFQRLHSREKYDGTGIGLALCKKIVERHGGRISVSSEPGNGSTFSFTIPMPPAAESAPLPATAKAS